MEQIDKHTKLNKGDCILIKQKENSFENAVKSYVGILRDYDNKKFLSGCIEKLYINFKISGIIREIENVVFCWYKKSFMVLSGLELFTDYKIDCEVDIFKLSKKEAKEFIITKEKYKKYLLKENICKALE